MSNAWSGEAEDALARSAELEPAVVEAFGQQRYADALRLLEEGLEIEESALGPEHPEIGDNLMMIGIAKRHLNKLDESVEALERGIRVLGEPLEKRPAAAGHLLYELARSERVRGRYVVAASALDRALPLATKGFGEEHPVVREMQVDQVRFQVLLGAYEAAVASGQRLLAMHERVGGLSAPNLSNLLGQIASAQAQLGDYGAARISAESAYDIARSKLGNEDATTLLREIVLASILRELGETDAALDHYVNAVAVLRSSAQPVGLSTALTALGELHHRLGRHTEARALMEEALALDETRLGPAHPKVAGSLASLGLLIKDGGDPMTARLLFERALQIYETTLGDRHPHVASVSNSLGVVLEDLGDTEEALRHVNVAVEIYSEMLEPENRLLANTLSNLAGLEQRTGNSKAALELFNRVLDAHYNAENPDPLEISNTLNLLGGLHLEQGDHAEASDVFRRALEIRRDELGDEHRQVRTSMNNVAIAAKAGGDVDFARELLEDALDIARVVSGEDPLALCHAHSNLSGVLGLTGEPERAREHRAESMRLATEHVLSLIDGLSEREALRAVEANRGILDLYLTTFSLPSDSRAAWSAVLNWKGAVSRTTLLRNATAPGDVALVELRAELAWLRRDRSTAAALADPTMHRAEREEQIEREIARLVATHKRDEGVEVEALCAALPADAALVDFVHYQDEGTRPSYAAFLVSSHACDQIVRVELGAAAPIDEAVLGWREVLASGEGGPRVQARGERVADLIWEPLREHLADHQLLLIAPDAALTAVPFAALPVGEDRFLLEDLVVAYLDSAIDVVSGAEEWVAPTQALIVGGVDFGAIDPEAHRCRVGDLAALPGTAAESEAIAAIWQRRKKRAQPVQLGGVEATEARVSAELERHDLLHLATHGFFATDCGGAGAVNPLTLSGIALAGANVPVDPLAPEDGLLTAAEVSVLDLRRARLVVLSACDTGLGEINSGQGVLGLRRAFAHAGAGGLVMSLWPVPDEDTVDLMRAFYDGVLHPRRPLGPAFALHRAQLEALERNRRTLGEPRVTDWAAFAASGSWR